MADIDCILFDCMETLIDMTWLPSLNDYALWSFEGSGVEHCWGSFDEYFDLYKLSRGFFSDNLPEFREYELMERFEWISAKSLPDCDTEHAKKAAQRLYNNFWTAYRSKCYVRDDVRAALPELAEKYKLGVVSNFMVRGGIEELLEINRIMHYFDFVVTSVNEGWRKPHPRIYGTAVTRAGTLPERIVFVGDDYVNDYTGPAGSGMNTVLLDRYGRYSEADRKISSFHELRDMILQLEEKRRHA